MTRPTHTQSNAFTATSADLPLFSGTPQAAPAQVYAPKEQPQQDSMFDRREYIARNPAEYHRRQVAKMLDKMPDAIKGVFELEPDSNTEARQQMQDSEDEAPMIHEWHSEVHPTPDGRFAYTVTARTTEENAAGSNFKTRQQARRAADKALDVCRHADKYRLAVYNGEIEP